MKGTLEPQYDANHSLPAQPLVVLVGEGGLRKVVDLFTLFLPTDKFLAASKVFFNPPVLLRHWSFSDIGLQALGQLVLEDLVHLLSSDQSQSQ